MSDANVAAVVAMLQEREAKGLRKYGVTTAGQRGLGAMAFLRHLHEELLDASVYIEAVKNAAIVLGANVYALSEDGTEIVPCGVLAMRMNEDQPWEGRLDQTIITLRDGDGVEWERSGDLVARTDVNVLCRIAESPALAAVYGAALKAPTAEPASGVEGGSERPDGVGQVAGLDGSAAVAGSPEAEGPTVGAGVVGGDPCDREGGGDRAQVGRQLGEVVAEGGLGAGGLAGGGRDGSGGVHGGRVGSGGKS